jgi:DNA adenine methylase
MARGYQAALFPDMAARPLERIVNVASVPQRSPFRYPGGKTWLIPHVRQWLRSFPTPPALLIEPFVGGGIVSLTAAFEHLAARMLMVELDAEIAAVWQTIIHGDGAALAERIVRFTMTREQVELALAQSQPTTEDQAFMTILKNRVYHGGILAPGSGLIKYGENGKGLTSRWYPETLKKRILNILAVRDRMTFIHGDGLAVMRQHALEPNAVYFIDPPYTAAGKKAGTRLYTHNMLDHEELFRITAAVRGDFLMTYDAADDVRALAIRHGFDTELVPMKNTHHARMHELLIGRNLDWARRC